MTPKKYYQVVVGLTLALIVAGGIGYFYALELLYDASGKWAVQKSISDSANDRIANLINTQNRYSKEIEPLLPQIAEALPTTPNQTEILDQLRQISDSTGVSLSTVSFPAAPAAIPVAPGVVPLAMSFQISGSFTQVQTFLADVENLSRMTTVDNLTVTNANKTITYNINLTAYSKP